MNSPIEVDIEVHINRSINGQFIINDSEIYPMQQRSKPIINEAIGFFNLLKK